MVLIDSVTEPVRPPISVVNVLGTARFRTPLAVPLEAVQVVAEVIPVIQT